MSTTPIEDHALISDCRSTAIIDRAGSVEWLCWPRVDAPSVFGRLLDPAAGHWSIAPVAEAVVARRYVERTMVLETRFVTTTGTLVLTDALSTGPGERGHELGHRSPRLLVRRLTAEDGPVAASVDFDPRYGERRRSPRPQHRGDALECEWAATAIALRCSPSLAVTPGR